MRGWSALGRPSAGRVAGAIPVASGAAVMGTGIIGIALRLGHRATSADALLALSALTWVVLGVALGRRGFRDRARLRREADSPAALTWVAATAVLGAGATYLHWRGIGIAFLIVGSLAWLVLTRRAWRSLEGRTGGEAFMLTVGPEGLAALAALLASPEHGVWLAGLAIALALAGFVLYPFLLGRFDARTLATGRGEHWIAGGALAISSLAFSQCALSAARLAAVRALAPILRDLGLALWALAILWLPALVAAELRWPRLRYGVSRWSTVFPLGMYTVCSFAVATATGTAAIGDFAHGWLWAAVAGWAVVLVGTIRRGVWLLKR